MRDEAVFAFEQAPVGIIVTEYRRIVECNACFAGMFGYDRSELIGQSLATLYPSLRDYVDIGASGLRMMQRGGGYRDSRIMQRRDGIQFWCQVHGRSATPEDPFRRCVWTFVDLSDSRPVAAFTRREREIAMQVAQGFTNKDIALALGISFRTVEAHRSRIARKIGARTAAEMISRLGGLPGPHGDGNPT